MNLDEVLRDAESSEVFIAGSDWFSDSTYEELEETYAEFEQKFEHLLPTFVERLGPPDFTEQSDPELSDELYCEARRVAGWKQGDGYLLLACGQHDKETPVFVSFGYRAIQED